MKVLRTMYSLRMSFWMVPVSLLWDTPCSSAATMKKAKIGRTAPTLILYDKALSNYQRYTCMIVYAHRS